MLVVSVSCLVRVLASQKVTGVTHRTKIAEHWQQFACERPRKSLPTAQ